MNRLSTFSVRSIMALARPMNNTVSQFRAPVFNTMRMFSDDTKNHGTVKWFDPSKGFAFITREDEAEDLFVHFTSIVGEGYRSLEEGQRVTFGIGMGPKGAVASDVEVMN